MGMMGAGGQMALRAGLRQRIEDQLRRRMEEQQMALAARGADRADRALEQSGEANRIQQEALNEQRKFTAANMQMTNDRGAAEALPPGRYPATPLMGRLEMMGGAGKVDERPRVDVGPLLPGDTGAELPAGYEKYETAGQSDKRLSQEEKLADNTRQAERDKADDEYRTAMLNKPSSAQPDYEWVTRSDGSVAQIRKGSARPGDRPYDKAASADQSAPYEGERNKRNRAAVDQLMTKVSPWTTGPGSALSRIPGSDARNFAAELDTLKANIAFGELAAMRAASKTGGALGQVSNIELRLLESSLGALDTGQSPANIKAQLQKIRDSLDRWAAANPQRTGNMDGGNTSTVEEWERGPDGRPRKKTR